MQLTVVASNPKDKQRIQAAANSRPGYTEVPVQISDTLVPGVNLIADSDLFKTLQKGGLFHKARKQSSFRGQVFTLDHYETGDLVHEGELLVEEDYPEPKVVHTYQVMFCAPVFFCRTDHKYWSDLIIDLTRASRLALTGTLLVDVAGLDYQYTYDIEPLYQKVQEAETNDTPFPLALDLETLSTDEHAEGAWIISIQWCYGEGVARTVRFNTPDESKEWFSKHWAKLQLILSSPQVKVWGANLKFDMRWLAKHAGIEVRSYSLDTTLLGGMLDENRSNSLENHTWLYAPELGGYDSHMNQTYDKGRMDLVPHDDFLLYSAGDVDAVFRVARRMMQVCPASMLHFYIYVMHPMAQAYARIEINGVLVDEDYYNGLTQALEAEVQAYHTEALAHIPNRVKYKHVKKGLKVSRAAFIGDAFFSPAGLGLTPKLLTKKTGKPSTSLKDHLQQFDDDKRAAPLVAALKAHSGAEKTRGTYCVGFLKHLRSDGRFHPSYFLHKSDSGGTNTGRSSCTAPAFQTVPKHTKYAKPLRRAFVAPPGYQMVQADYSQGELRIAACLANDKTMIQLYNEGIDLHIITGHSLFAELTDLDQIKESIKSLDKKTFKYHRQAGKSANFGMIYGISPGGYQTYAAGYQLDLSLAFCEKAISQFFALFSAFPAWHAAYKAYAQKHKAIVSPLGRVRHLPLIDSPLSEIQSKEFRRAVNAPVQSTLSDMMGMSFELFHQQYPEAQHEVIPMGTVHDSGFYYIKEDNLEYWCQRIKWVMENLPLAERFNWKPPVNFDVDFEIGPNMRDLKEVEGIEAFK